MSHTAPGPSGTAEVAAAPEREQPLAQEEGGASRGRRVLGESGYYLLVGLVTSLVLVPAVHLMHVHLAVPFYYRGDALSGGANIKNVLEHGWIDYFPSVGAPYGRHGNDFPGADNLHLMIAAAFGVFSHRWAVVQNAYFLLTFPLIAMTAAWYFRVVGVGRLMGGALAVLFAFAPYHFLRGEEHLYLSAYYVVPLAGVLLHRATLGESLWGRRSGRLGILTGRTVGAAVSLILLGTASSYYSVFTLMLLTIGGLVALLHTRPWRRFGGIVSAQLLLMAVMVANMLPNILYERRHGANLTALVRLPNFTETHALKLSQLLLPVPYHRVASLRNLRTDYDRTFPLPSEHPALGFIAAAGFVILIAFAVVGVVRRTYQPHPLTNSLRALATLTLTSFLIGTVGGLATLFALFVTDSLRGWDRIVIFLALFSLAAVGLLLDRAALRTTPALRRPVSLLLALVVVAVGLLDQVPPGYPQERDALLASWGSDEAFVSRIEGSVPRGAMIVQLPYVPFPESRVNGTTDSDPLRMYLHSTSLRWSNGGIKGRAPADWESEVAGLPGDRIAAVTAVAGFSGAVVDTAAYKDGGKAVQSGLAHAVGPAAFTSQDGRFVYYGFDGLLDRLRSKHDPAELAALKQHTLKHPVGYAVDERTPDPSVALDNPLPQAQSVDVTLDLASRDLPTLTQITWPDGHVDRISVANGRQVLVRRLELPPGRVWIRVTTRQGGAADPSSVGLVRYRVATRMQDSVLEGFLP